MMEVRSPTESVSKTTQTKQFYHSNELSKLIDDYFDKIDILSLDCFDTIIWRHVTTPVDVFYDLQNFPMFQKLGINARIRIMLENTRRQKNFIEFGTYEVTLSEIYKSFSKSLNAQQITDLVKAEVDIEHQYCFSFTPIVELMREAIKRKKKIAIVSDTYFTRNEVSGLLEAKLPKDVFEGITKIFVSNEHKMNKASGLHSKMLNDFKVVGSKVLHVGDNHIADYVAPKHFGIHTAQLLQFSEGIENRSRMRSMAASIMMNEVRHSEPLFDPYRALMAKSNIDEEKPQIALGYGCLGPIYYSFAEYLKSEINQLSQKNNNLKVLFLLRDGYLPKKIFDVVDPSTTSYAVRISRFVAYAASFKNRDDIINYLSETVGSGRYKDIARQLLLTERMIENLMNKINQANEKRSTFIKNMLSDKIVDYILRASHDYLIRLMKYLEKSAGIKKGDTLLFVDLGYSGTAQNKLAPVFESEFGIKILGRYLLALDTPGWKQSKAGLLDPNHCDDKLLHTLVTYIALLEQLSTTTDRSVVDFDEDGEPILGDASLNDDQHTKLTEIQSECERFAKDMVRSESDGFCRRPEVMRQIVISELTRLLYFPFQSELNYLNTFKFDLNCGTNDILEMFDASKGSDGLRRRGMFFMERNSKTMRTNYPAELRVQSLPVLSMLLTQHRRGLEFNLEDVSFVSEDIPIYILHNDKSSKHIIHANSTYDGYYSLVIPLGTGQYVAAAGFGERYSWVQIYAIELLPLRYLNSHFESIFAKDVSATVAFDKMDHQGDGLFYCDSPESMAIYQAEATNDSMVLRIIFRPIVNKG